MGPRPAIVLAVAFVISCWSLPATALEWQTYEDARLGYRIPVPVDVFTEDEASDGTSKLTFYDPASDALLEVYGGQNAKGLSVAEFARFLSAADRIDRVTYQRGGKTWLVLSGYYAKAGVEPRQLVFYAKFLFSRDLSSFVGFEISYPRSLKSEFDPIVEVIEDGFRSQH